MARVKETTLALGITLNLGNFQSARIDISETVALEPGDDPDGVRAELRNTVLNRLNAEIALWKGTAS